MKNIRRLFLIISLLLFGWLFIQIFYKIDLIPNYTRTFISEDILKIENFKSLNELKEFSKSKVYSLEKINREQSNLANKQLIMIFILVAIQLFLYLTKNTPKSTA
jgi:hypothetical protein